MTIDKKTESIAVAQSVFVDLLHGVSSSVKICAPDKIHFFSVERREVEIDDTQDIFGVSETRQVTTIVESEYDLSTISKLDFSGVKSKTINSPGEFIEYFASLLEATWDENQVILG